MVTQGNLKAECRSELEENLCACSFQNPKPVGNPPVETHNSRSQLEAAPEVGWNDRPEVSWKAPAAGWKMPRSESENIRSELEATPKQGGTEVRGQLATSPKRVGNNPEVSWK